MEPQCPPAESPTTSSSGSSDLYDNYCPHYIQRERARRGDRGGLHPAVTGVPTLGRTPAGADVPTVHRVGGRGAWPDPDRSWDGGPVRQGWEAELGWRTDRAGGGGGGGGGERGGKEGEQGAAEVEEEERLHPGQSPSPSRTEEHKSALSVYDNLQDDVTALHYLLETDLQEDLCPVWVAEQIQLPMETGGGSRESSLWSSCEIVLAGSSASSGLDRHQDLEQEEPQGLPEPDAGPCIPFDHRDTTWHQQLPTSYLQPYFVASLPHPSQTGLRGLWAPAGTYENTVEPVPHGPRVPPPLPPVDPSARALRSLLTSLQQKIMRQRDEYEARITSLEQRNDALQGEMAGLNANLAQQQRWYRAVQAQIQESQRRRAAAELRNAALQREMDQCFDTFGELNSEAQKAERIVRSF